MTTEEIKSTVTMADVLSRYGMRPGRSGMICCPFHNEKNPSMKIFKDGYKCFACNENGDVFKFVQKMEGCDFKQAFRLLGGTYEHSRSRLSRTAIQRHYERERYRRAKAEANAKEFRWILEGTISLCQSLIQLSEPLSDDWCYAQNRLQWLWHVYEIKYLEGEGVNESDVFRVYREVRQRYVTV